MTLAQSTRYGASSTTGCRNVYPLLLPGEQQQSAASRTNLKDEGCICQAYFATYVRSLTRIGISAQASELDSRRDATPTTTTTSSSSRSSSRYGHCRHIPCTSFHSGQICFTRPGVATAETLETRRVPTAGWEKFRWGRKDFTCCGTSPPERAEWPRPATIWDHDYLTTRINAKPHVGRRCQTGITNTMVGGVGDIH